MKKFLLMLCALVSSGHASNVLEVFPPPADNGVRQSIVLVSGKEYARVVPSKLKELLELPKTEHEIIHPLSLFAFSKEGAKQLYKEVLMDEFFIAKADGRVPFIATRDVCDCVGVKIVLPGVAYGLMHVSFKGFDDGKFATYLAEYPKDRRAECKVNLLTSYLTDLTREVYDALIEAGFKVESADIPDYYLSCEKRTSNGKKYIRYLQFELSSDDMKALKKKPASVVLNLLETRAPLVPDSAETPRIMILDIRTGKSCQLLKRGFFSLNNDLFKFVDMLPNLLKQHGIPPHIHEKQMKESFAKYLKSRMFFLRRAAAMCLNSMDLPFGARYWKEDPVLDKAFLMQAPEK